MKTYKSLLTQRKTKYFLSKNVDYAVDMKTNKSLLTQRKTTYFLSKNVDYAVDMKTYKSLQVAHELLESSNTKENNLLSKQKCRLSKF